MNNKITFNGNDLFNINANLYGNDNIRFKASKQAILKEFKTQFTDDLKNELNKLGLKFKKLSYYSPREYNFQGDSIDLTIEIIDYSKFKKEALKHKDAINKQLSENKSYDGYLALTSDTLENGLANNEIDTIMLGYLLTQKINFDFDVNEYTLLDYRLSENN